MNSLRVLLSAATVFHMVYSCQVSVKSIVLFSSNYSVWPDYKAQIWNFTAKEDVLNSRFQVWYKNDRQEEVGSLEASLCMSNNSSEEAVMAASIRKSLGLFGCHIMKGTYSANNTFTIDDDTCSPVLDKGGEEGVVFVEATLEDGNGKSVIYMELLFEHE